MADFTFIDLFAGIGGLRIPFDDLGGECVFSSEIDDSAARTYNNFFNEKVTGDITVVKESEIPKHDLLLAGFPCQPFSIAGVSKNNSLGRGHGFSHATKGTLFFEVVRILKHHKPKAFLLENVKGLVGHDGGKTFKIIKSVLEVELGYKITHKVINAKLVVPQNRERIFIVGIRSDISEDFQFPTFNGEYPKFKSIKEKNLSEFDMERFTLSDHLWAYLKQYKKKHQKSGNGFGFGYVSNEGISRTLSARYGKDGSEILVRQKGKNPRKITHIEAKRLMGFPEHFQPHPTQAYKQFGNAVVPKVVELFAKNIVDIIMGNEPLTNKKIAKIGPEVKKILESMESFGAKDFYIKELAANDNSKNQIYVGGNISSANMFYFDPDSKPTFEGTGRKQRSKIKIPFHWLDDTFKQIHQARQTKLILYPQYPEVRLSGFLQGCKNSPTILSSRQEGRVLFLGITGEETIAYVVPKEHPAAAEISVNPLKIELSSGTISPFKKINHVISDNIENKLKEIIESGPHDSVRLSEEDGCTKEIPFSINHNNAAGYTLEAKLGILPNGKKEPDYDNHELKTLSLNTSKLTIMTPEPDSGLYVDSFDDFMMKYGYEVDGEYKLNGVHRVDQINDKTKLTLKLDKPNAYQLEGRFDFEGRIYLEDTENKIVAQWELKQIVIHFIKKHSSTVIVRNKKNKQTGKIEFLPNVRFLSKPSVIQLLLALEKGWIVWDPGLKLSKKRNQFRISLSKIEKSGIWFYDEELDVTKN